MSLAYLVTANRKVAKVRSGLQKLVEPRRNQLSRIERKDLMEEENYLLEVC